MRVERKDALVITLEGDEVTRLWNFVKNAIRMGYTSKFDEGLIKQIAAALEGK